MDRSCESKRMVQVAHGRSMNATVADDAGSGGRAENEPSRTKFNKKYYDDNNDHSCPFILVDGNRYYADRFYLLTPNGDEACATATPPPLCTCTCGAQQPPPTLDRARLIQSLDLDAVILGTYTVSPSYVMNLFDNIPTLVLHGHKGLESRLATHSNHNRTTNSSMLGLQHPHIINKPDFVLSSAIIKDEEVPPEEECFDQQSPNDEQTTIRTLPSTLYMTRILTTWLPDRKSVV